MNLERLGRKSAMPEWIAPMLATLTDRRFSHSGWRYERKLDGQRCLAFKDGAVKLYSRNRKNISLNYPEIVLGLENTSHQFIIDGEIVALEGDRTSFSLLQPRMQGTIDKTPVFYYVFDIIYLDGIDLSQALLIDRRKVLETLKFQGPVRILAHSDEGLKFYEEACSKGWEGLIAKDKGSCYHPGRSSCWLKFKCLQEQEFVIGGYSDPLGSRTSFGAVLVGYYEGDKLIYAGKVGTGFSEQVLKKMGEAFKLIDQKEKSFESDIKEKGVHWVRPVLVCQVKFTEWTPDGKLRHPTFAGLRFDKDPKDVHL